MNIESVKLYLVELRAQIEKYQRTVAAIEELYGLDRRSDLERTIPVKPQKKGSKPLKTRQTQPKTDGTKRCNKCGDMKPLERFAPQKDCTGGRQGTCRDCTYKRTKERAAEKKGTSEAVGFPTFCALCHSAISSQQRYIHHMATVHPGAPA